MATLWAWRALHPMACSTPLSSALLYRAAWGGPGCMSGPCSPQAPALAAASTAKGPAAASAAAAWGSSAGQTSQRSRGGAAPPSRDAAGGQAPGSDAPRLPAASTGGGQGPCRSCLAVPASSARGSCSTRSTAIACKHVSRQMYFSTPGNKAAQIFTTCRLQV